MNDKYYVFRSEGLGGMLQVSRDLDYDSAVDWVKTLEEKYPSAYFVIMKEVSKK